MQVSQEVVGYVVKNPAGETPCGRRAFVKKGDAYSHYSKLGYNMSYWEEAGITAEEAVKLAVGADLGLHAPSTWTIG